MIERALELYRRWVSPALHSLSGAGGACRFQPTCSEYAVAAFAQHGAWRASALVAWRLLRCNPFCRGGFDPVPRGARAPQEKIAAAAPGTAGTSGRPGPGGVLFPTRHG